jgi:hypothetical protein
VLVYPGRCAIESAIRIDRPTYGLRRLITFACATEPYRFRDALQACILRQSHQYTAVLRTTTPVPNNS